MTQHPKIIKHVKQRKGTIRNQKNDGIMSQSCKIIHCYQQSKGRAGEVKAGERSTSCISSIKKQCFQEKPAIQNSKEGVEQ